MIPERCRDVRRPSPEARGCACVARGVLLSDHSVVIDTEARAQPQFLPSIDEHLSGYDVSAKEGDGVPPHEVPTLERATLAEWPLLLDHLSYLRQGIGRHPIVSATTEPGFECLLRCEDETLQGLVVITVSQHNQEELAFPI